MLYVLHKNGKLFRNTTGTDWRARKKHYTFVTVGAAKAAIGRSLGHIKGLEIVPYIPGIFKTGRSKK
jgi:hypothetical protein